MDRWPTFFPVSSLRKSGPKTSIGGTSNTDTQVPVWLLALQVLSAVKETVGYGRRVGTDWKSDGSRKLRLCSASLSSLTCDSIPGPDR